MAKRGFDDGDNLDEVTNEDVNSHLMQLRQKEGVKVVAKATPLADIWADVRQPRRAIPASIRLHWDGSPGAVEALLMQWDAVVRNFIDVDTRGIIRGNGDGVDLDGMPSIVESYVALLRLASDIKHVGLTNPITVVKQGQRHLIESGERRYLAHHLLMIWDDAQKWDKVPAIISDGKDFVWRQASENTARRSLNPIGMARQLALLIMDAREGLDGMRYDAYEHLVLPGGCDRRFYAQVANGNIHRIPKGMGERIQSAMGLSEKRLADYRKLLKLTDDDNVNDQLWVRADVEDWAEGIMREIGTLPIGKVSEVMSRDEWTLDDLRALVAEVQADKAQEREEREFVEVRGRETGLTPSEARGQKRILPDKSREFIRENRERRDWQREHEERTERYDDDLAYGDDDGDDYLDDGGAWMPNWQRGTLVIVDEDCAEWKSQRGFYRPNNAYIIPAGTTARIKQLFTQNTRNGQHSLARIAVGAYEHIVPVQVLALVEVESPTRPDSRQSADDHIATLTGDEVARGMASDNGDSAVPELAGDTRPFMHMQFGHYRLFSALYQLLRIVSTDSEDAVLELQELTMDEIEQWERNGVMTENFTALYERIKAGMEVVLVDHLGVMMAQIEELVRGEGDDNNA